MSPESRASARPADRKAVLFCPACGHEAPLDGDWSIDASDGVESDRTDVTCPACGDVVVSQPQFAAVDGGRSAGLVDPALQLLHAVVGHDVL